MKKLGLYGIMFALLLIIIGAIGFVYLIQVGGAGPEKSWAYGMGPLVVGLLMFAVLTTAKSSEKGGIYGNEKMPQS